MSRKKKSLSENKGKILIMDDEKSVREVIGWLMEELGYQVETVGDGKEAVELFKKAWDAGKPFNSVILDINVPEGLGGRETFKELKKIDPEIKAVATSGYSDDPVLLNPGKHGFKGFISKPFKIVELKNILNELLSAD